MIAFRGALTAALLAVSSACPRAAEEPKISSSGARSYLMGFSVIPPRPDIKVTVQSLGIWSKRADAAIMHLERPERR